MTESFPRLFLVRDLLKNGHKIIVPPKADLEKYPYIKSCLSSLSITEEDMIEIPESGAKFSNLIMPSHVKFHPDVVIPAITYLKNHFYDPDFIFNHAGVYISREKARVRGCSNEKEVELICKYFGFKKIIMEDSSWILIRTSGTEPLVRVYVEAVDEKKMEEMQRLTQRLSAKLFLKWAKRMKRSWQLLLQCQPVPV